MDEKKETRVKKVERCSLNGCKKKLDMTCISCSECSLRFCFKHMNRHSHNCCVDVKSKKIQELKLSNPTVQVPKVEKL
jgi:hypothetical protein